MKGFEEEEEEEKCWFIGGTGIYLSKAIKEYDVLVFRAAWTHVEKKKTISKCKKYQRYNKRDNIENTDSWQCRRRPRKVPAQPWLPGICFWFSLTAAA